MKVFCQKCVYVEFNGIAFKCNHEQNKKYTHDWYSEKCSLAKEPKELNKNNDCPWFVFKSE